MGGSKGGGSSTTVNTPLTKQQYDPTGYAYREKLLPMLMEKYGVGLTPQEQNYYRGQVFTDIGSKTADTQKGLLETLGRLGIKSTSGAAIESLADLDRSKIGAMAGGLADLTGKDIGMKQQNLQNLLNLIADSGMAGTAASTTTTSQPSSSPIKSGLSGALGGAMAGSMLPASWGLGPFGAIGGAILGGLGGLL